MSYTVEKLEKSQVKLSFDIDSETFAKAVNEAYQKTKHKFAIAGFRKGHVPKKVIEGLYGKEVFFEDAMDIVIPDAYSEALQKETELEVVAQPELTAFDFKEDGGATFVLNVTVKPEVKLGDYKGLGINKKVSKVTAKSIDAEVEATRQKQARLVDVEAEAKNGSVITLDFEGSVDGELFEGGTAQGYELELGSNSFIPGFEDQLVGIKAGEEKDVKVTFPEDYHAEELKGKEAVFACKVSAVKEKELPELDDEFVKEISEFDTLAEYKADVKVKLKEQNEKKAEQEFEDAIVQKIVENSEIEVPDAMVDAEAEDMVHEFEYRLMYQGMKLDDYLGYLKMTKDQLKNEYKAQAEKSVKVRLVMEQIVKTEDIKFEDAEIDAKLEEIAKSSGQSLDEFRKTIKKEQIDYVVNQILSEKLMAFLKTENAGETKAAAKKPAAKPVGKEENKKAPAKKTAAATKKAPAKKAATTTAKKAPAKKAAAKSESKDAE